MCNLFSITSSQAAIRQLARAMRDVTGNLPPMPAVFPDQMAPVVRTGADGVRELVMMRWGFQPPSIPGSKPRNPYLTNVRNTNSSYWKPWLSKPAQRCLVPATSFAEPDNNQGPRSIWTWFAQDESRPLMFFAGIWREWDGDRGTKMVRNVGNHLVFSFLTTDASHDVAPVHSDATPVCLLDEAARDLAIGHLAAVRAGKDPAAEKQGARDALTVGQLCDEYLEATKRTLKASTHANDKGRIECHIRPQSGRGGLIA
jgi:putative SOS response-associated peptidase YedK